MEQRKRRSFTPEFRAEAVRMVREGSKSLPQVAKDVDLTESALRNWVREAFLFRRTLWLWPRC